MTVIELYRLLEEYMRNGHENLQVLISEMVLSGGDQMAIIRDLDASDLKIEPNLDLSAAILQTQFNKGLVVGFVPTVD